MRSLWASDQLHIVLPSLKALHGEANANQGSNPSDIVLQQTMLDVLLDNNVSSRQY